MLEAKRRCTLREFKRWAEYETIEPFGDYWQIQQGAVLLASVLNAVKGKKGKAHKPSGFLPKKARRRRKMTDEQMRSQFTAFVSMHNASEKKKA